MLDMSSIMPIFTTPSEILVFSSGSFESSVDQAA
jgi:hypothetical protein